MARKRRNPRQTYTLDEGRVYRHKVCGDYTCVAEEDFAGICNPFQLCLGTWCNSCNKHDGLKNFAWEDTKERLTAYRKRLKQNSPPIYRVMVVLFPVLGLLLGLLGAFLVAGIDSPPALIFLPLLGLGIMQLFVTPFVFTRLVSTKFYKIP